MNIVVPMAGDDALFEKEGYGYPKNFIEIVRKPLFQHVYSNLASITDAKFIFIVKREEVVNYHLDKALRLLEPNSDIVLLEDKTGGAACSVMLAAKYIDNNQPLIIANGDQMICDDLQKIVNKFQASGADGGIITFESVHPRWSYVRVDKDGFVVETAEKQPISKFATAGFYYFKQGRYFVDSAKRMIKKDASVNGRYFVSPAYNEMILQQKKVITHLIRAENYFSLSTPKGLMEYSEATRGGQSI